MSHLKLYSLEALDPQMVRCVHQHCLVGEHLISKLKYPLPPVTPHSPQLTLKIIHLVTSEFLSMACGLLMSTTHAPSFFPTELNMPTNADTRCDVILNRTHP